MHPRARQLIDELGLQPHPEGGLFKEVYRSADTVSRADGAVRAALTTIFFLLPAGAVSRWHRVTADEVWHHYEGDALELHVLPAQADQASTWRLGRAGAGIAPVRVVPAGAWQAARTLGEYTLVGCTVAPGFDFADFTLLHELPPAERPAALRDDGGPF